MFRFLKIAAGIAIVAGLTTSSGTSSEGSGGTGTSSTSPSVTSATTLVY